MIFESGARAVGAAVLPAGVGQTELQVRAARDVGCTAYAGTPDYLKVILDKADEMGVTLAFTRAAVGGGRAGGVSASLRQENNAERGIACLQCYATADLGNIAYESPPPGFPASPPEGDDRRTRASSWKSCATRHRRPRRAGRGGARWGGDDAEPRLSADPASPTGDLSAVLPGQSPCGRTNMRIKGWMGPRRPDHQESRGMFRAPPNRWRGVRGPARECPQGAPVIATRSGRKWT